MSADFKIYVVDDDPKVLQSVRLLLRTHGYDARCFESAEAFLHDADPDGIGCVIMDLRMPGIGGAELQQRLRRDDSPLAVVVVTAHADVATTVDLMKYGAVSVLEKPFGAANLVSAVELALRRSQEMYDVIRRDREVGERLSRLSDLERQVMRGMIAGTPTKALANELGISMRTIDRRRQIVLQVMQVESIGELGLLLARRNNSWASPP